MAMMTLALTGCGREDRQPLPQQTLHAYGRTWTYAKVEIRVKGLPDSQFEGTIEKILPAGQERLPSAALGYAAGGSMATVEQDHGGTKTAERFFEIHIVPKDSEVCLFSGQRVIVRFETSSKPLMVQWWRSLLQLFQRRFNI